MQVSKVRTQSIIWFERTVYLSSALTLPFALMTRTERAAALARLGAVDTGTNWGALILGIGINLILGYCIARRGSNVAKWILVVLFGLGLVSMLAVFALGFLGGPLSNAAAIIQLAIQGTGIWLLFHPASTRWFRREQTSDELGEIFE